VLFDGYVYINDKKYYVNNANQTLRDKAEIKCESLGMNLVAFESKEKWETISSWLLSNGKFNLYAYKVLL